MTTSFTLAAADATALESKQENKLTDKKISSKLIENKVVKR